MNYHPKLENILPVSSQEKEDKIKQTAFQNIGVNLPRQEFQGVDAYQLNQPMALGYD